MASNGYLIISGERQGLISAGCNTEPSMGARCQLAHQDEITLLDFSQGIINTENSLRATHQPVSFTKLIDKASPLLGQAMDSQEVLDCVFHFYRTHPAGHQEKYFTIKLEGAVLVELDMVVPHAVLLSDQDAVERVSLRYRTISWLHHAGGTSAHASWEPLS
ncbi:Hcp family type VI secretion system effector [Pseudomonas sp. NPDC089401]|uniref:Hcp family type VI secretion system effector n=1 Tax=Pseudomonas sp. NPDC089401 TaxID=3364462 RepID=UPI00381DC936